MNFMYSKVTKFGGQMASIAGGARLPGESAGRAGLGFAMVVTLLYPK
jgi:hypothetical protein